MRNLSWIAFIAIAAGCVDSDEPEPTPVETSPAAKPGPPVDCRDIGAVCPPSTVCNQATGDCDQQGGGGGGGGGGGDVCNPSCSIGWHCVGSMCQQGCVTNADCGSEGFCTASGTCLYPV